MFQRERLEPGQLRIGSRLTENALKAAEVFRITVVHDGPEATAGQPGNELRRFGPHGRQQRFHLAKRLSHLPLVGEEPLGFAESRCQAGALNLLELTL